MARFTGARPFKTDYAGAWGGYCKTRESAINAAFRHVTQDGYRYATITDLRTMQQVAHIQCADDRKEIVTLTLTSLPRSKK